MLTQTALYVSGTEGYHTFRIPALAVTPNGTILAIAEGRRHSVHDTGDIDLVAKRSVDGGRTWGPLQVVVPGEGHTSGNPTLLVDRASGRVLLPFCRNRSDGDQTAIMQGKSPRTVWITHSDDAGRAWSAPRELTAAVKDPRWTWYGVGPGHGMQLRSGRLVIPAYHVRPERYDRSDLDWAPLLLSDDGGATWRVGAQAQAGAARAWPWRRRRERSTSTPAASGAWACARWLGASTRARPLRGRRPPAT
ncbi:MAG: exo-alpha-sialidase [Actinobacteria bacterium]|nr:exo-alpha-sialidase [Actinomycetota bacterium]